LKRPEIRFDIPMAKVPKTLPRILSREEVHRLLAHAANLRARTLLMVTYAAGLRVSEVCALQLTDIESAPDRMCIKVRQGKGSQDRYTMLSPALLETLRDYCRLSRPVTWLFPNPTGTGRRLIPRQRSACTARHGIGPVWESTAAFTLCATIPSPGICRDVLAGALHQWEVGEVCSA
jgi:integrase